jgi:helix-turn-helix protein
MSQLDEERLAYTPAEVGKLIGVDAQTVRRLIQLGKLDAVDVSAGEGKAHRWVVPRGALHDFLDRWRS